ncbi:uncharacterized protein [Diadema setosum]|uniref:uncharacterized protein n=1 Tax=Diadema setosum TaxID=31175 RepID=UPI003B3A8E24
MKGCVGFIASLFLLQARGETCEEVDIKLNNSYPQKVITKTSYRDNEYCNWYVEAPTTYTIRFTVQSLYIEHEFDIVYFGNEFGVPFRSKEWCQLTGSHGKKHFQSNSNHLVIIFTADATKQKTGFQFSLEALPESNATVEPSASCFSQQSPTEIYETTSSSTSHPRVSDMQTMRAHPVRHTTSLRIVIVGVVVAVLAIFAAFKVLAIVCGTRKYRRKQPQASSNSYLSDNFSSEDSNFSTSFSSGSMILHDSTEDLSDSRSKGPSTPLERGMATGSEHSIMSSQTRSPFVMNQPQGSLPSGSSENLLTGSQVQTQYPEVNDSLTSGAYSDNEIGVADGPAVTGKVRHSYFPGFDCSSMSPHGPEPMVCPLHTKNCDRIITASQTSPMSDDISVQDEGHRRDPDIDFYVALRCGDGKAGVEDVCPVYSFPNKETKKDFGNTPSSKNVYLDMHSEKNDTLSQNATDQGRAIEALNPCYRVPCEPRRLCPDSMAQPRHLPDLIGSVQSLIETTPTREQTNVTRFTHSDFSPFGQPPLGENKKRSKITHTYFRGVGFNQLRAISAPSVPAECIYDEAKSDIKLSVEDYFEALGDVQELQTSGEYVTPPSSLESLPSNGNPNGHKIQHIYFGKWKFTNQCHEGIPTITHESFYDDATSHHLREQTPSPNSIEPSAPPMDTPGDFEAPAHLPAIKLRNKSSMSSSPITNSSINPDYVNGKNDESTTVHHIYFGGVTNRHSPSEEDSDFDDTTSPESPSYRQGKTAAIVQKFETLRSTSS